MSPDPELKTKLFYPVNYSWLNAFVGETAKKVRYFSSAKLYWNDKDIDEGRSTIGIIRMYSYKIASKIMLGAFQLHAIHAFL